MKSWKLAAVLAATTVSGYAIAANDGTLADPSVGDTNVTITKTSAAQITVSRSIFEFSAETPIQDLDLLNTADFRIFLDFSVSEIVNPHSDAPERVLQDDPRTADVLISPAKVVMAPGQRKRVRIVLRRAVDDVERIYRLAVKPHVGKIELDEVDRNQKKPAIKVLLGYDLLLIVRPTELQPKLEVTRQDDSITFRNEGNTNIMLRKMQQCNAAGEECVELPGNRLYAEEVLTVNLPKTGTAAEYPVEVWQSIKLDSERKMY